MRTKPAQKNIPEGWRFRELDELLEYEQPQAYLVSSTEYRDHYNTPVLTAGKTFILGYINETKGVYKESLPVIIFDDFTTAHKWVDFPFKAKSSAMKILKPKNNTNLKFVYGWMNIHPYVVGEHKRNYLSEYRYQDVLTPPLPEQNRIVAVLETWDKAIESLKKKIELKKEVKKGLMQLLLSRKIRLKGFTEKWETVELGNISNFVNGYTFKSSTYVDDGMYKIITIANVQDGHLLMDKPKLINELPSNLSREQILSKGDILISMTGNVGRVCIVDQDGGLLNQRVGKIIPRGINKDLFYLFLHDRRFLNTMIDSAQGGAQGNLSTSDIKLYRFDIPTSSREQDMLADILTASNKEIQVLELKQKVMQEQKTYLLNHLITGQIRTPENLKIFS